MTKGLDKRVSKQREAERLKNLGRIASAVETAIAPPEAKREPGAVIGGHKISWTRAAIMEKFKDEMEKFIPAKTFSGSNSLQWNGVSFHVFEGVETTVPRPIKDLYDQHMRALVRSSHNPHRTGEGALEPYPTE